MQQRIRNVRIRNFQSIKDADLDLDGLTVVVGHSNAGKSSLVRALQASLFNWTGGSFVREGATEAEVDLVFANPGPAGDTLQWRKPKKGGARYFVHGPGGSLPITRAGKEMPPQIAELTGIREIEAEGVKAKLQFDAQFDAPFLLAGTGGQAARLLARIAKVDVLVTAQIRAKNDAQGKKRQMQDRADRAQALQLQLASLPDFDSLLTQWKALSLRIAAAESEKATLAAAIRTAVTLQSLRRRASSVHVGDIIPRAKSARDEAGRLYDLHVAAFRLSDARQRGGRAILSLTQARGVSGAADESLRLAMTELSICPLCGKAME